MAHTVPKQEIEGRRGKPRNLPSQTAGSRPFIYSPVSLRHEDPGFVLERSVNCKMQLPMGIFSLYTKAYII